MSTFLYQKRPDAGATPVGFQWLFQAWVNLGNWLDVMMRRSGAGVYTPTTTDVTNMTSSSCSETQYSFTDGVFTLSGEVSVTAASAAACEIGISLPDELKSAFSANEQLSGIGYNSTEDAVARLDADATNDRIRMRWTATSTNQRGFSFIAHGRVIKA